jgi:hypothetical protein
MAQSKNRCTNDFLFRLYLTGIALPPAARLGVVSISLDLITKAAAVARPQRRSGRAQPGAAVSRSLIGAINARRGAPAATSEPCGWREGSRLASAINRRFSLIRSQFVLACFELLRSGAGLYDAIANCNQVDTILGALRQS